MVGGVYADHGTLEEMYQVMIMYQVRYQVPGQVPRRRSTIILCKHRHLLLMHHNWHCHHCHYCHQTIESAVRAGLNYVDTSPFYGEGKSEEVLGMVSTMMMTKTTTMIMITTMMAMAALIWAEAASILTEQGMH